MIHTFKVGTARFVHDVRHSIPLSITVAIIAAAFVLVLLVSTQVTT